MNRVVVLSLLLLAGCAGPDLDDVAQTFRSEHPTAAVTTLGVGEGDDQHAYVHIRFRATDGVGVCEVVWGYCRTGSRWTRFSESDPEMVEPSPAACL